MFGSVSKVDEDGYESHAINHLTSRLPIFKVVRYGKCWQVQCSPPQQNLKFSHLSWLSAVVRLRNVPKCKTSACLFTFHVKWSEACDFSFASTHGNLEWTLPVNLEYLL